MKIEIKAPNNNKELYKSDADTNDIIDAIVYAATRPDAIGQIKEITIESNLQVLSIIDVCHEIFKFVKQNIKYKADADPEGKQFIYSTSQIWLRRYAGVDSKSYALYISSILTVMKIPHSLRFICQKLENDYHHVYVVVHDVKDIIIDPVMNNLNVECNYIKKTDRKIL